VSKPIGILFCTLVLLAGCATRPKKSDEIISSPAASPANAVLNWEDSHAVSHPPARQVVPPAPVVTVNSPPRVVHESVPAEPVTTWSSLNRWAAEQKVGAPQLLSSQPRTYSVSSSNGIMVLAVGSHEANWNGVELLLGFAPEFIDGQLFAHGLDLQKNLQPLLCAPPLTFDSNRVIVIDPGHGGGNTGTKSVRDGRFEKEFTLDLAKRVKPLLEQEGWTVFLTRTNDTETTLPDRIAFAEAHHAGVFISLHFNSAAPDTQQSGLETYCLTPTGMPSNLTRGYDDTVSQNFPDNHYDDQNLQLAMRLQSALLHASGEEDRGVRRARFMGVLSGQHQPAILIEGGYLSNPHEAEKIESAEFRQKLAEAVAAALRQSENGK
jgi:N-acetylmuramoyl-L-alanine amidase